MSGFSVAVDRVPTLKDVSAAIAAPIELLGWCRDAAGTHGVRAATIVWRGEYVELPELPELERLEVALARARAAQGACENLAAMLEHRRDGLARRQAAR